MGREKERRIEGGDSYHGSNRKAPHNADTTFSSRDYIERNDLAANTFGLLGSHLENGRRAHHLTPRVTEAVPGFERHLTGEEIRLVSNYLPGTRKDLRTTICREPACDLESIDRRRYRVLHILWRRAGDESYRFSRVRINNRLLLGGRAPAPAYEKVTLLDGACNCIPHVLPRSFRVVRSHVFAFIGRGGRPAMWSRLAGQDDLTQIWPVLPRSYRSSDRILDQGPRVNFGRHSRRAVRAPVRVPILGPSTFRLECAPSFIGTPPIAPLVNGL